MTGSTPSTSKEEYYSVDGIPWVTPTDINTQIISDTPRKLSEEGAKVGRVVPANTILCTCIASIGKNALLTVEGSFNQQINSLTPYTENNAYFLLTESEIWSDKMKKMAASGTMQIVNKTEFSELITMVPKTDEQKKIGDYFRTLDNLITLHQRECEQAKKYKKYMLQKMFPQNGSNVPEIRFSGFTHPWEQRKLSEIALQTYCGGTPKTANEEFWKGNIPWIQSSDLLEERLFNVKTRKYISQEAISKSSTKLVPQNSIAIVTRVGVGKLAFMPFSYATSQDFLSLSELKIEPEFAVYALYKMMRLVSNEVQGTSIKGITKDELLAKEILIPDCEEQKKIGAYLHNLDHLITLHR